MQNEILTNALVTYNEKVKEKNNFDNNDVPRLNGLSQLDDDFSATHQSHKNKTTRKALAISSSWKYGKENLPKILSGALDQIVGQLGTSAQTVNMLNNDCPFKNLQWHKFSFSNMYGLPK